MNVLITGGTGFIGSRLALRCLQRGDQVRVLAQENTGAESENRTEIEAEGAEVVLKSVTAVEPDSPLLRNVDVVFHLAAIQHEMDIPDSVFREVNVGGTRRLLEAAAGEAHHVVHGSTIGVYGDPSGIVDDDTEPDPDNIYGVTKLEGERLALEYSSANRVPVTAIRIPETYGPGDRRLLKLFRGIDRGTFPIIGSGENLHHLIFVEDLVDGLLCAAEAPEASGDVYLLAGKEAVTTNEMVDTVAEVLNTEPPKWRLPLAPFTVLATVLEWGLRPLGIQPPLHRRRLDFFRKSFTLSATEAESELGFQPTVDFEEGARRTAQWYRDRELL